MVKLINLLITVLTDEVHKKYNQREAIIKNNVMKDSLKCDFL